MPHTCLRPDAQHFIEMAISHDQAIINMHNYAMCIENKEFSKQEDVFTDVERSIFHGQPGSIRSPEDTGLGTRSPGCGPGLCFYWLCDSG